ncbi:MAG: hypothetical protein HYV67_00865, partial [Candidatus Taylorbacteria bacterium]|nr:hypothetical protein [Candidatus Taylorbacteria bacterium]
AAKKSARPSEDGSAGGFKGGMPSRPSIKIEASPAALLVQSRTPKKSFVFLLEEKIGRAQIKKCEQNFSLVWRALASGGGAERQFRSKKFRAKFRISHHFAQKTPHLLMRSFLSFAVLAPQSVFAAWCTHHPNTDKLPKV